MKNFNYLKSKYEQNLFTNLPHLINSTLLILFLLFASYKVEAQCDPNFFLETSGFYCNGEGTICLYGDNVSDCGDYEFQLSYPTGSFVYSALGYYWNEKSSDPFGLTILNADVSFVSDGYIYMCLDGLIQIPNTTFTIILVNKTNPLDILSTFTFKLDDYILITGTNTVSSLIGTDLLPPTFPPNPIAYIPQKIVIDGLLMVDVDYGFASLDFPKNEIILTPDSRIAILPGITFSAYRTKIYKCPNEAEWDQIQMEPTSKFQTWRTDISGAKTAIWMKNNTELNSGFTRIHNNIEGLRVTDNATFPTSVIINAPVTDFDENKIGIVLYRTTPISLYQNGFDSNSTGIYMYESALTGSNLYVERNTSYGINATYPNAVLNISDSRFIDNKLGVYSNNEELDIQDNVFEENERAIFIYAGNDYHSYVKNNQFSNNLSSLTGLSLGSRAEIIYNDISLTTIPFYLNGTVPTLQRWLLTSNLMAGEYSFGGLSAISSTVGLNNTEDVRVHENIALYDAYNTISLTGGQKNYVLYNRDVTNTNIDGRGLLTTSSPINYFRCNNLSAITAMKVLNNNNGSEYSGNHLTGYGYNLQYGDSHNTYAVSGLQYFRDNTFDLSSSVNPKARHYDVISNTNLSIYRVNNTNYLGSPNVQGNIYFPFYLASINNWFQKVSGTNYVCERGKEEDPEEQFRESQAADDNIQLLQNDIAAIYGLEVEFDTRLKLMRYLSFLNDHNALSQEQNEWYNSLQGSSFDLFIQAESQLKSVSTLAPETEENLLSIEAAISEFANALKGLHFTTFNEETEDFEIDELVKEQYMSVKNDLSDKINEKSAILNEARQLVIGALSSLDEINNAVDLDGTTSMSNLKTINTLLYKRLSSDTLNYSGEDKAIIISIADQCIGEGGEAVTQARSMRSEFDFEAHQYDDECLVAQGGEEQRLSDSSVRGYSLSPNPANNYTLLTCPKSEVDQICSLIDLQGNAVKTVTIPAGMEQVRIDLEKIGSGIYYININNVNISKKLVKIN